MSDHFMRPDNDQEPTADEFGALADEYQAGLDKCRASGYEEYGHAFQRRHGMVITALRAYAGRVSSAEMQALVAAIIEDEAKYDPTTNTWDVQKAAEDIVTTFETA